MTIYEYEQKYTRRENVRGAKLLLRLIAAAIGVFLFFCLFSVTVRVYEMNMYAGIGAGAVELFIYTYFVCCSACKNSKNKPFRSKRKRQNRACRKKAQQTGKARTCRQDNRLYRKGRRGRGGTIRKRSAGLQSP